MAERVHRAMMWLQRQLCCRLGAHEWTTDDGNPAGGYFVACAACGVVRECPCRSCRTARRVVIACTEGRGNG